jgi:hypothetical protein
MTMPGDERAAKLEATLRDSILLCKFALLSTTAELAKEAMVQIREWEKLLPPPTPNQRSQQ